jgi:hypothetical protein
MVKGQNMKKKQTKNTNKDVDPFALIGYSPQAYEALWRVVDAARLVLISPEGPDRDEMMRFLADQEKMLRRAVAFFYGPDGEAELRKAAGVTRHPYVSALELEHSPQDKEG